MFKSFVLNLSLLISTCCVTSNALSAPELTLKGLDGLQHSVSEYIGKGQWTVVNIWGPKCPPCIDEIPELQNFHDDHKDKDAIVLGIAIDFPSFGPAKEKEVLQFSEDYFISFPVLLGDAQSITHLGGGRLRGTPTTLLFDPTGKLRSVQIGQITQRKLERFIEQRLTLLNR